MNKYKIFLTILGIFCVILVTASFIIGGTPVSQQALSLDQIRLSNFNEIHMKVEDYYKANNTLPSSVDQLDFNSRTKDQVLFDPETKKPYGFKLSPNLFEYELCTTFSASSADSENNYSTYPENDLTHKKGYDCVRYKISTYLLSPTPYISPSR